MNPSLRLGIELPPVAAGGGRGPAGPDRVPERGTGTEEWWRLAAAGVAGGAGTVWVTGNPESDEPGPAEAWCDPCTLAGALAPSLGGALIGVVSPIPGGRHPSVLARDVTTIDVLSAGRTALQLRWEAPPPTDVAVACEHLADAVAVCAAMLRGGEPSYDGRYFHVSGAFNRPVPRQAGGPPVLVAAPEELGRELNAGGRRRTRAAVLAGRMAVLADAVVCPADPATVAAWRAVLDQESAAPRDGARRPGLVCTVAATDPAATDPEVTDPEVTEPGAPEPGASERSAASVGRVTAAARDAGADGTILRLATPYGSRDGGGVGTAAAVSTAAARAAREAREAPEWLTELVAAAFAPWVPRP